MHTYIIHASNTCMHRLEWLVGLFDLFTLLWLYGGLVSLFHFCALGTCHDAHSRTDALPSLSQWTQSPGLPSRGTWRANTKIPMSPSPTPCPLSLSLPFLCLSHSSPPLHIPPYLPKLIKWHRTTYCICIWLEVPQRAMLIKGSKQREVMNWGMISLPSGHPMKCYIFIRKRENYEPKCLGMER